MEEAVIGDGKGTVIHKRPQWLWPLLPGFAIATIANGIVVWSALSLLSEPSGSEIRPMGEVANIFLMTGIAIFIAIPLSVFGMMRVKTWHRWVGIISILLGLATFPLGMFLFSWIIAANHLILKP
jgi:hypothetical protein